MLCKELVSGWPDYVATVDASGHGVGIVVVEETKVVNTNSDLESAGAVLALLVVEATCELTLGHMWPFIVTMRPD